MSIETPHKRPKKVSIVNRLTIALTVLTAVVVIGLLLGGLRNRAAVLDAVRTNPGTVSLTVSSCNQNPFLDEMEETSPGIYEVLVRKELSRTGEACADELVIDVNPSHETIEIVDRVSGETFNLLGTGEPAPLGLDGTWRMVTVDMGNPVEVGSSTAEIPEITFAVDGTVGALTGNFGCNTYSIDVTFGEDTVIGVLETHTGTKKFCADPDRPSEYVLTESTMLELLTGGPAEVYLSGDRLEIGTLDTNAVFERVAPE